MATMGWGDFFIVLVCCSWKTKSLLWCAVSGVAAYALLTLV